MAQIVKTLLGLARGICWDHLQIRKNSAVSSEISLSGSDNAGIHLTDGLDIIHSLQKMIMDSEQIAAWSQHCQDLPGEDCPVKDAVGNMSRCFAAATGVAIMYKVHR